MLSLMVVFAPSDYYRYALCESGTQAERVAAKMELCLALKAAAWESSGVEGHSAHQYGLFHVGLIKGGSL